MGTSNEDDGKAIQRQMALLRQDLVFAVDEASATARQLKDWRYYVHRFPWAAVGLTALAGFALVPRRTKQMVPDADQITEIARKAKLVLDTNTKAKQESISRKLLGIVALAATRAAVNHFTSKMAGPNGESPVWTKAYETPARTPR